MNSTQLLLLGLLVWFAMSNKSKDTRNVILVVAGILFFCMMNVKEGFVIEAGTLSGDGNTSDTVRITAGSAAESAEGHIFTINKRSGLNDVVATAAALTPARNGEPVGPEVTCEIPEGGVAEAKWAAAAETFEPGAPPITADNIHRLFVCSPCTAGQTVTAGVCSDPPQGCPPGQYAVAGGACTDCAAGTFKAGTGPGPCTPCSGGKTSPPKSVSATACTAANQECPAGKYLDAGKCTNCEKNTYKAVPGDGKALCIACDADQKSVAGATSCEPVCDAGESCKSPSYGLDWLVALFFSPCGGGDYCQE